MHLLETNDISKTYAGRKVVDGVRLTVKRGEIVGLLGPNGAGKTTTFYMIVGLIKPEGGEIIFDGKDITNLPMYLRARLGVGYLSQEPQLNEALTVKENVYGQL